MDINDLAGEISSFLNKHYGFNPKTTSQILKYYTSTLRNDLTTYVEYPYIDKVFRNSYYCYFSTKLKTYDRDCMRVSFFNTKVTQNHFREENLYKEL